MTNCAFCGFELGDESVLGTLGRLLWFRCRACGGETSIEASDVEVIS